MSDQANNPSPQPQESGRNLYLFLGGMVILGIALAFLLFGGQLFEQLTADSRGTEPITEAPQFEFDDPAAPQPGQQSINNVELGDIAPDFTLMTLDGEPVQLADLQGRPVIINFWATWCAPCRLEMPELQQAFEDHAADDLAILAVNREENPDTVRAFFVDELGLTFTPLLDDSAAVANTYGVFNMPTTYFLDTDGEVKVIHRGPMTKELIDDYVAQTLEG